MHIYFYLLQVKMGDSGGEFESGEWLKNDVNFTYAYVNISKYECWSPSFKIFFVVIIIFI